MAAAAIQSGKGLSTLFQTVDKAVSVFGGRRREAWGGAAGRGGGPARLLGLGSLLRRSLALCPLFMHIINQGLKTLVFFARKPGELLAGVSFGGPRQILKGN